MSVLPACRQPAECSARSHRPVRAAVLLALLSTVSTGCLVTSPYYGQSFSSRNAAVPFQAWTLKDSGSLHVECAPSGRFGPAPFGGPVTWSAVTDVPVSPGTHRDPRGGRMSSASTSLSLPASCWQSLETSAGLRWYTALRVTQDDYMQEDEYEFRTFDAAGLECLGREVGKARSWTGYADKDCVLTYSNSDTPIPFIVLRASS